MRRKRGQTYLDTLTDREVQALASTFCHIPQNLDRPGFRWMYSGDREAVTRAFKKIELERRMRRWRAIYKAGFAVGKSIQRNRSSPSTPTFEGRQLGSMESIEWYRGKNDGAEELGKAP